MKPYKLSEYLSEKADAIENKRSAECTRLTLLAGAAKLSESEQHQNIRIPQLCKITGIARATYYLHFRGKDELLAELMEHLIAMESALSPTNQKHSTPEEAIRLLMDWYITLHISNGRLFFNLSILRWSDARINDLWLKRARELHEVSLKLLSKYPEFQALDPSYSHYVLELTGSGMNTVVARFASGDTKNPFIPDEVEELKKNTVNLIHRALFGKSVSS